LGAAYGWRLGPAGTLAGVVLGGLVGLGLAKLLAASDSDFIEGELDEEEVA
jgi:hypothetical protein